MNEQASSRLLVTNVITMSLQAVLEIFPCVLHNSKHFKFLPTSTFSIICYTICELTFNYHEIFYYIQDQLFFQNSFFFFFNIIPKAIAIFLPCIPIKTETAI